jgi:hypothetical protein
MLRKNKGRLNGWISYTLSKSEQQTQEELPEESGINGGNWFLTYDKLQRCCYWFL